MQLRRELALGLFFAMSPRPARAKLIMLRSGAAGRQQKGGNMSVMASGTQWPVFAVAPMIDETRSDMAAEAHGSP
ncbi:hypothetical protein RGR602_CH02232 [Rhizobium gallicum bv. gallicum R602sp]|uniref:Uncharacterized protein n=1 Tax=Rhizobium gallicum bv. gallicum R602sp TaxID=1041138 RepID=A0A0B4X0W3_9HYPH|nr:hypothetical protein RGR602_CH02232 [Rhizobium gallicum bv. gallicum R602sp]